MEKNITLCVLKEKFGKRTIFHHQFDTVTEAYKYYVKHYATLGDWVYYLLHAHLLLSQVDNEEVMECLFSHLFRNGCINYSYEYRQKNLLTI